MTMTCQCGRPATARRAPPLCGRCWLRWRIHGDATTVLPKSRPRKWPPVCGHPDCDRPHHANGWCSMHAARVAKWGDPDATLGKPGRNRKQVLTYEGMHKRLTYDRGPASAHHCIDCGGQARDWSYNGGAISELVGARSGCPYSLDPADYSPRCVPCHRTHDNALRKASP